MKVLKFGLIEELGNDVFFNLGTFETFEEAVKRRELSKVFRENNIFIIRRFEE